MRTTKRPTRKPQIPRHRYDHDISVRRIVRRNNGPGLSFAKAGKNNPYSHVPDLNPHWLDEEWDRMYDYKNTAYVA